MATITLVFFVLGAIVNSIYFIWIVTLWAFPKVLHMKEYKSSNVDQDTYNVYIIVPCLNEELVCEATIRNMLSFNMENLKVIAIDDDSSDRTLEILKSIKNDKLHIIERKKPNAQLGKGKALNSAYKIISNMVEANGENPEKTVIAVFDADTFIKKDLIEKMVSIMKTEPKCGMVQCRVRIGIPTRDYLLSLMQDIEFYTCINLMQNVREYTGTVGAAGNGQFNRMSAMKDLGDEPWSDCLLEDFDFSVRLLLKGWRTRLLQDENVYQQAVLTYKAFVKQRSRWAQGGMQSWHYINPILKSKHITF